MASGATSAGEIADISATDPRPTPTPVPSAWRTAHDRASATRPKSRTVIGDRRHISACTSLASDSHRAVANR
jgi:hypothetical protein